MRKSIDTLGVKVNLEDYDSAITEIENRIASRNSTAYVTLMSANNLVNAQCDGYFKKVSNAAFLALPDGMPLVWISRLKGMKGIKARTCGPTLMYKYFEQTVKNSYKHFFYGGKEGVAEKLKKVFESKFPGVNIVGTYCPPFTELIDEEDRSICEMIDSSGADIVWVGLSTPKQEIWMYEHMDKLRVPVLIGVGAAFDFHIGNLRRAPSWMQNAGLEWFFRLFMEPRRLWRRYLIGNPLLIYWLMQEQFGMRKLMKKEERIDETKS